MVAVPKVARSPKLCVCACSVTLQAPAKALAQRLGLLFCDSPEQATGLYLYYGEQGLALSDRDHPQQGPVYADFVSGKLGYRKTHGSIRHEAIARAVGLKGGHRPGVLDVTAGLGRDAFILASLGCHVTLLERHPIIHALLEDALHRAQQHPPTAPIIARMRLKHSEASTYLADLTPAQSPEVIYLDPMYPQRDKSALVKKEMRVFKQLLGEDEDAAQVLQQALGVAQKRVVVKRPAKAEPLGGCRPSHQLMGSSTRMDIYLRS